MVELNQYYTSNTTSSFLVSQLNLEHIKTCLELSAGQGALIDPIKIVNSNIKFTTVDIDLNNSKKLQEKYPKDIHICDNALNPSLELSSELFDLAVCNPPFASIPLDRIANDILGTVFSSIFKKHKKIRLEILFILKNLQLIKANATLAIIVPDLIINSAKLSKFREVLFTKYTLTRIVEFEHKNFKKTEAKTFILFIKKSKQEASIYSISYIKIENNKAQSTKKSISSLFTKKKYEENSGVLIYRGSNSSKECRESKKDFHHNYSNIEDLSSIEYSFSSEKLKNFKYALAGDILIHRIGRDVGKTVFLKSNQVIVSDCIIVLRFSNKRLERKFINNWRAQKRHWLEINSKGTCAKHISIRVLKSFISSL